MNDTAATASGPRAAVQRVVAILKAAAKEFGIDGGLRISASLSYYTIFSLVPLLLLVVSIAGFVFDDPAVAQDLVDEVTEVAGAEVGDVLDSLLEQVAEGRAGTLSLGLVLAVFFASGIFQQVQAVLSGIFHVPRDQRRTGAIGWLVKRGIALVSALVLAVLVFVPITAVAAIDGLVALLPDPVDWLEPVLRLGVPVVSLLLLMVVVGVTFQAMTSIGIPWKAAVRGGATTALVGLTAAFLVGFYLTRAGSTGTLGVLGGVAILLFFFNLMWAVYVFGAEVTKVYVDYLEHGDVQLPHEREGAVRAVPFDGGRLSSEAEAPSARKAGFLGLVVGAVLGWTARRRD
jgi:membrane protein